MNNVTKFLTGLNYQKNGFVEEISIATSQTFSLLYRGTSI